MFNLKFYHLRCEDRGSALGYVPVLLQQLCRGLQVPTWQGKQWDCPKKGACLEVIHQGGLCLNSVVLSVFFPVMIPLYYQKI